MSCNGVEEYHGCKINWVIGRINGTGFWRGTALVMLGAEASPQQLPEVRTVPGIPEGFISQSEAREMVLKIAREFIDSGSKIY
jgi:hypothetical protein